MVLKQLHTNTQRSQQFSLTMKAIAKKPIQKKIETTKRASNQQLYPPASPGRFHPQLSSNFLYYFIHAQASSKFSTMLQLTPSQQHDYCAWLSALTPLRARLELVLQVYKNGIWFCKCHWKITTRFIPASRVSLISVHYRSSKHRYPETQILPGLPIAAGLVRNKDQCSVLHHNFPQLGNHHSTQLQVIPSPFSAQTPPPW